MLSLRGLAPIALVVLSACGSQAPPTEPTHVATGGTASAPPVPALPAAPEPPATEPGGDVEAAPALTLALTKREREITLALQNRGRTAVHFSSTVLLEEGDEPREVQLRLDEAQPLPSCAELAPGALLELTLAPGGPGPHRFAVLSCDRGARVESELFSL